MNKLKTKATKGLTFEEGCDKYPFLLIPCYDKMVKHMVNLVDAIGCGGLIPRALFVESYDGSRHFYQALPKGVEKELKT